MSKKKLSKGSLKKIDDNLNVKIVAKYSQGEVVGNGKITVSTKNYHKNFPAVFFSNEQAEELLEIVDEVITEQSK